MSICVNHTNRAATTRCSSCHKPICDECVVKSGSAIFCSQRCLEGAARFNASFKPQQGPGFFGNLKNTVIGVGGLVLLGAILVFVGAKILNIGICIKLLKMVGM